MVRAGVRFLVIGAVCGLLAVSPTGQAQAAPAARASGSARVSVPAYLGKNSLSALLPGGGRVHYRLPSLPSRGVRLMGDWDGDGTETPGIFVRGRWELWNQLVRPRAPDIVGSLGQGGDIPVTGDWNGDGVTDVGVVRGSTWFVSLGPMPADVSATVWRQFTFGTPRGVPVAGDWNGDGVSGPGTVHGRHWRLAPSVDALSRTTSATYGRPGDVPVVGDWDGDGIDGLGVVRGQTWYLQDSVRSHLASRTLRLSRPAGGAAVPWQVPVSGRSSACPTRRSPLPGRRSWVVPSTLLDRAAGSSLDATARRVRGSLEASERYLLGAQYDSKWRATRARAYLSLLHAGHDELAIRLPAMSALTVAIGLRTGAADPARVGAGAAKATGYVDQLVRSIACEHEALTPGGWGLGWETAHWAMLTGAAAWLVWDRLTPETRSDVVAMMVSEADRQTQLAVPYWALPDGTVVTPGDTKAEECAWNAGLLSLAAAMMPAAPDAALWRAKAAELAVAAYSTPADLTSSTPVNGVSLEERLQGYNAYPDGTVENHHRIHPDYAANIQLLWLSADFDRLARQSVPEAMFHDGGLVYSSLSTLAFQAGADSPAGGTFAEPGGTVYVPGTNTVYYPQGDDWGVVRRAHFVSLDAHALTYGPYLGATGWPAAGALARHEQGQRALVAASGTDDGRTYSIHPAVAARQDTYPGREEYAAQSLASAWLALYIRQIGVPALDTGALPLPVSTRAAPPAPAAASTLAP